MYKKTNRTLINSNHRYGVVTPPPPPPPFFFLNSTKKIQSPKRLLYSLILILFFLSACAGGGSNPNQPTDTTAPTITNHSFAVTENIDIGTVIGTVDANDNITVIFYLITAGDTNYDFSISTNGEIRNIMELDHDTISNYSLTVQVSDAAGNTSTATIAIIISNVDAAPTVSTSKTSGIQNSSVTLNGNVSQLGINSDGDQYVNEYGFVYSSNVSQPDNLKLGESGVGKIAGASLNSTGTYAFTLVGLSQGTVYYFRAFAINDGGTSYGNVSNFSTTCHQTFTLSGSADGEQSNLLCPYSLHTYTVPLNHELVYSLIVDAISNVMDSVTIYEGGNTEPLYIMAGPFTDSHFTNITFPGADSGRRYMVLPLASNTHQIVLSNNSSQSENYSLNLKEYQGINPSTGRLLTAPQKIGYYDSTNGTRFFWTHLPPNKNIKIELDAHRGMGWVTRIDALGANAVYSTSLTNTVLLDVRNVAQYFIVVMNDLVNGGSHLQTNARLIFHFVD